MRATLPSLLLLTAALTGCIGAGDGDDLATQSTRADLEGHPFPDGDEGWPIDLTGPFELGETLTDPIESFDGTPLETTIYLPELPAGIKAPVILWSQPYTGTCPTNALGACMAESDSEFIYEGGYRVDPSLLVENGFAVAIVNVRGTGNSGGCFENGGENEQRDQVHLVEHLAEQPWSNGHVAMYGHSYHGFTPWMAAIQAPPALKTVVASGLVTDPYTFSFTPQGAALGTIGAFWAMFVVSPGIAPPIGGDAEHATVDHAPYLASGVCPELAQRLTETQKSESTDHRDAAFWDERRLITGFPNITASVLVSHGLNDDSGHAFQEDDVWHSLPAELPKRMILGQWGHDLPPPPSYLENAPFGSDWHEDTLVPWLDYWLKGVGDPEALHLGKVHMQDTTDGWHETTAWPPAEAREEVLYLAGDSLAPEPAKQDRTFLLAPGGRIIPCATLAGAPVETGNLLYVSEPVTERTVLAGNPFAWITVSSDLPGGTFSLDLVRVPSEPACQGPLEGIEDLAHGAVNLRFHAGGYQGGAFPVMEPTPVRVDIHNDAVVLESGERIGLLISQEGSRFIYDQPYHSRITLHGGTGPEASHLVLPLVEGTLGGQAPTLDYPPQPFLPPPQSEGS